MKEYPAMTVYSASAGAGKTFTLAVRYIELLIENPYSYRETLAVTFTNKATEEMKLRIMSQLYGLAHGLKDSTGYLRRIQKDMELDERTIRSRAALALRLIMHDYSHFAVETIDAFFQRVLRNLARELELSPNLRVELNDVDVEELAVDELVTELHRGSEILDWIMEYVSQQMDDEKDWNVINNIKQFGRKIFSDQYKKNSEQLNTLLSDKDFFIAFRKKMREMANPDSAAERMKARAEEFFGMISEAGYSVNSFAGKSRSACSYFTKLQNGNFLDGPTPVVGKTVQEAIDGPEGWTKESPSSPIYIYARAKLVPFINKVEAERRQLQREIFTAQQVLHHLNDLRLLNNIEQKVHKLNKAEGRFLLSDTQSFLEALMKESDAPFVYEKIGGRLQNIMIDEFQDTSTVQWKNFKKLLLNTLSEEGSKNLIVGDVKQSIYRWRNGDWSLLQDMDADEDISRYSYERIPLRENWRSEERIISFNNEFFERAALVFRSFLIDDENQDADVIAEIYTPEFLKQIVPEPKRQREDYAVRGLVDITLLSKDDKFDADVQLERTAQILSDLFAAGAQDEDIAILLRDNNHISQLADFLQQEFPTHRFVSNEAFRLDASIAVEILITAMRVLLHPHDELLKAQLAKTYQEKVLRQLVDLSLYRGETDINSLLPKAFCEQKETILAKPMADIAEDLIGIFALNTLETEAAYIYSFLDILNSFTQKNVPDLIVFLQLWDDSLHKKTVQNGGLKGINLITIHKSKGLEFKHVIMPFCNWELTHTKGVTLWCQTDEAPFSDLPVVPVKSTGLRNTVYSTDFHRERLQNCIDNLNLLYVAFTRAAQNLFVIGQNVSTKSGISTSTISCFIQRTLPLLGSALPESELQGDVNGAEEIHFSYGSLCITRSYHAESENVFLRNATDLAVEMKESHAQIEFRQSNESRAYVSDEPVENNEYIEIGTILHDVLSRIDTHKDIERVLQDFEQEGLLTPENSENSEYSEHSRSPKRLANFLRKRLTNNHNAEVNRWFADDVEVMNECTIVFTDPRTGITTERRPDRVVIDNERITIIDFKFGNEKPAHRRQVKTYIDLLRQMGYTNIEGRLWYVYQNEIVNI